MTRLVSTTKGIARVEGDLGTGIAAFLDVHHCDLGAALAAGLTVEQIAVSPVRETAFVADVDLLPTIPRPSKIWAVGFAYADHRTEIGYGGADVEAPMVFFKAPSSTLATGKPIRLPRIAPDKVDYEGELGVVIGRRATDIAAAEAVSYIAGYTICNDVSARDVQKGELPGRAADVSSAKSFDTFTPMGPCLTTLDEFADPNDLRIQTWVDGELRQDSRTSHLIHPVPDLIAHLSQITTLEPGDVISTGTPAGVGHKQGKFLRSGSTVRISIEGIGDLVNTCA